MSEGIIHSLLNMLYLVSTAEDIIRLCKAGNRRAEGLDNGKDRSSLMASIYCWVVLSCSWIQYVCFTSLY
uniref:Uncharacterized protein n=1 Tax=Setaria viridis TaxID=4556 RepID=A0A4V6D8R2_SETVI|nr:hypothetical protein SEVIR_4G272400v2 [Setaria viridis]